MQILRCIFSCLLILVCLTVQAQPLIVADDLSEEADWNISDKLFYIEDAIGRTAQQVLLLPTLNWQENKGGFTFHKTHSPNAYWFKIRVTTSSAEPRMYYLQLSNRGINETELFLLKNGQLSSSGKTGDFYPFSQRPFPTVNFTFPIYLQPGDTLTGLLYCDKRNENLNVKFRLLPAAVVEQLDDKANLFIGIFSGVLLMAFVVSLILLVIFKDLLNLWYAVYIVLTFNLLLTYEGLDFKWFYPEFPFYAGITRFIASSVSLFLMMHVMQLFCNQQKAESKMYRIVNLWKIFLVCMVPATWIIYCFFPDITVKRVHFIVFLIQQLLGIALVLISCLEKIVQRYRPAIFYFSAVSLLLYSGIISILVELGILNKNTDAPNLLQWSIVLEVTLISIGILYKYQLVLRQNRTLAAELMNLKLSSARDMLHIQREEQARIAEDLHDLMGAQLAAVKFKTMGLPIQVQEKMEILNLVDDISQSSRTIAHNLRPSALHDHDLSDVMATYIKQLNQQQSIQFEFIQVGIPKSFSPEQEMNLYKMLMELITNILRHSQATEAVLQFCFHEQHLEVIVEDNGKGLPPSTTDGMGLTNIRKRIREAKSKLHVDTQPGNTTFIITIPYFL
jgi:signal transduction histidine kinase